MWPPGDSARTPEIPWSEGLRRCMRPPGPTPTCKENSPGGRTYNFPALNRWNRFRVWLGHGTGLFPETFLKRCRGVTGPGTHISPNHLLE